MFVFRLGEPKAYFGTRLATGCGSRVSGAPLTASPRNGDDRAINPGFTFC